MQILTMKSDSAAQGHWKTAFLAIPLVFVLLAAIFAATPEEYRPAALSRLISGYPLHIELEEVEAITLVNDLAQERAERLAAEREEAELARTLRAQVPADPAMSEDETLSPDLEEETALANLDSSPDGLEDSLAGSAPTGLIPIDFDLAGGPTADSTIRVEKEVRDAQGVLGRIEVRIDNNSSIFVSSDDVKDVLTEAEQESLSLQQDFIPLSELREGGVNLRYDPTEDRFVLFD